MLSKRPISQTEDMYNILSHICLKPFIHDYYFSAQSETSLGAVLVQSRFRPGPETEGHWRRTGASLNSVSVKGTQQEVTSVIHQHLLILTHKQ